MPSSINKVILVGNLGQDPDIRQTENGTKIANFSVATTESWKDKNTGEKKDRTEWHRIVVFSNGLAELAEKYLKKGNRIYIEGALRTRKWQGNDGQDKYTTEIVITNFNGTFVMMGSAGGNSNSSSSYDAPADSGSSNSSSQVSAPVDDIDDEIPF